MYIIEVSDKKISNLADAIGKMLHYGGKAMECVEEMKSSERKSNGRYTMENSRHSMDNGRYTMNDSRHTMDDDDDDYDDDYDYGRGRERRGRYSRR